MYVLVNLLRWKQNEQFQLLGFNIGQHTALGSPVVVKDYTYLITPVLPSDQLVIGPIRLADLSINGVTSGVNTALTLAGWPHTIINTARAKVTGGAQRALSRQLEQLIKHQCSQRPYMYNSM